MRVKLALFVLEALPNARAVRRFVADHAADIVLVGLSHAGRPAVGGTLGQVRRHLARSGPRFLPYLAVNFGLPDALRPLARPGRGATATPLARLCAQLGIPSFAVDDVNGAEVQARLEASRPDLILTYHFDQILAPETIARARLGGLNVHPGLLPRHRGPVPTIHALLDGDEAWGVTLHRLVPAIDAGPILAQRAVALPPGTSATAAAVQLHEAGRTLVDDALRTLADTGTLPAGREAPPAPYCPFPTPAQLADAARRRLRLVDRRDLAAALALSWTE
jgi:methionyl-tRNA formyltransferase